MKFEITVKRIGWLWHWSVENSGLVCNDYSLTKRGAIWAANRCAKRWAKDRVNALQKETWVVEL